MACYYVVISSTHLRDGQLRSIKGVFRGPIGATGARSEVETSTSLFCELCNKQYERQQQYDNHISSYDHHHRQRLKELKQREFYRLLGSRRQRKVREQSHQERSPAHSVAGLGPMFRRTTVALDGSVDDSEVLPSNTEEPVTSEVGSRAQWLSCSPAERDFSSVDMQPSQSPHLWSEARVRPVCFSLPKRCSTLCHQSAAVFLQTPKDRVTQKRDGVDHIDSSGDTVERISEACDALRPTQEKPKAQPEHSNTTVLTRPKEPFCQVLSRDGSTVLLWPSEMVSYTHTAPSVSFSVNPLLHNFRVANTTKEVPVDKGTELESSEPLVIKRGEQQRRQADAQGGGAPGRLKRDRGDGGGQTASAAQLVAHCSSGNYDESALNRSHSSEFERHLVIPEKKRRRRRTKRRRRRTRRRKKEIKKQRSRPRSRDEGLGRQSNSSNAKEIKKDQVASNDHKRAELLSHLPVSHFNRCNQLCTQVNSQASRHLPPQSVSEWGQGFRKLHGGRAACSTAISLVPGSDIEIPHCPAITPCPAQSCTDVWEAHAEKQQGENDVVQEEAAKEQELVGKRTFDEAFDQEPLCCQNTNVPAGESLADHTALQCDAFTEQVTIALTSSGERDLRPNIERPARKKLKIAERCIENNLKLMCISSDLSAQSPQETLEVNNPTNQMVTAIVKTNTNTGSHFVSRRSLHVEEVCATSCSCCQSTGTHRVKESSNTECGTYTFGEWQDKASEINNDGCKLTAKNAKNQAEKAHCTTTVSQPLTDLDPAEPLSCQCNCSNHFTNCNCTEKDTNNGVVNVVLISTHPEQTISEDERKQVQETMREEKRENKREDEKVPERRKVDWSDKTKRERACLPLPPPYLPHHTFLQHHFVPLSQPIPPFHPFLCPVSPQLPLLPPLPPLALFSSAPAPLLDGPYPLPAFPSLQSGGPSMYGPLPPALVPMHFIFSKSAAFSIS